MLLRDLLGVHELRMRLLVGDEEQLGHADSAICRTHREGQALAQILVGSHRSTPGQRRTPVNSTPTRSWSPIAP